MDKVEDEKGRESLQSKLDEVLVEQKAILEKIFTNSEPSDVS